MIDIHSHLLPGMDDGAGTLEESIRMCRMSFEDGVRIVVATPHTLTAPYENDRSAVLSKVSELNRALKRCRAGTAPQFDQADGCPDSGFRIPHSEFRILPGADVHFCERIFAELERGNLATINDTGKFLLVEFPSQGIPHGAEKVLFQLIMREITPIITHPERNLEISQRPQRLHDMVKMGCLGQVTAMSLTGEFGAKVKETAETLLTHWLVHFIASDAHSANGRPPILSRAVRAAERIVGKREAKKMVTDYPQSILEGIRPDVPEPIPL